MDANELGRWTRFAAKGGIGKCTALQDCIAEQADDLMFLKDDEITVLMQLPGQDDLYLGYCEGVVGRFAGSSVRFHGRLKKPVMAKRSSTAPSSSRPSSSLSAATIAGRISPGIALRSSPSLQTRMSRSHSMSTSVSALVDSVNLSAPFQSSPSPVPRYPLTARAIPPDDSFDLHSVSLSSVSTGLESAPRTPAEILRDEHTDNVKVAGEYQEVHSPTDLNPDVTLRDHDETLATPDSPDDSLKRTPSFEADNDHSISDSTMTAPLDSEHPSYLFSEPSTRISAALSDGEVGIGLSLLQDFVNGGGDSDSDSESRASSRSGTRSLVDGQNAVENMPEAKDGKQETSFIPFSEPVAPSPTTSVAAQFEPLSPPPPSPSIRSVISRGSMHPSATDSEYDREEWEGASDIYDNYRYSRFSMASKMSRLSKASMHTVASGFGLGVPPVPLDSRRPSIDSVRPRFNSTEEVPRISTDSVRKSPIPVSSPSSPLADNVVNSPTGARLAEGKHVPSPLTFASENTLSHGQERLEGGSNDSPLLHATFTSPGLSSNDGSVLSPHLPSSPSYSMSAAGAATALRQRLEMERDSRPTSPAVPVTTLTPDVPSSRLSTQPIVMEDDTEDRVVLGSFSPKSEAYSPQPSSSIGSPSSVLTSPTSPTSSYVPEKKAMRSPLVVMNPAPPPPYTPLSPTAASSSTVPVTEPLYRSPPQTRSPPLQPNSQSMPSGSKGSRQSLFLPHPHAPKPTALSAGPLYGRTPPAPMSNPSPSGPPPGSILHTLHVALTSRFDVSGRPRRTTIYGKLEQDLSVSVGPVPISFSLEPPNNIPANRVNANAVRPFSTSPLADSSQPPQPPHRMASPPMGPAPSSEPSSTSTSGAPATKVIPRANFFPKAQTPRPRSRSFSGFDSPFPEIELLKDKSQTSDDATPQPRGSIQTPPLQSAKRSKSASATLSNVNPTPQRATVSHATARSVSHKPSPLSLSQNIIVASPISPSPKSPTKVPTSPLAGPPILPSGSPDSDNTTAETQTESVAQANDSEPASPASVKQPSSPLRASAAAKSQIPPADKSSGSGHSTRPLRHSRSSISHKGSTVRDSSPQSRASTQGRRSFDTDASHYSDARSVVSPTFGSPPLASVPLGRSGSLRSKLSLPTLRIRNLDRSQQDQRSPTSSLSPSEQDQRTVQVKDTDFELVKPTLPTLSLASVNEDSLPLPQPSPIRAESSSMLRADSPALSTLSASTSRSRPGPNLQASPVLAANKKLDLGDVEAHRQRELKWISSISSIPASQARKSKKVRKLLQEGVPSSVRYLVWAHLTDSRSKRMDGLYERLGKRERVAASASIEQDVQRYAAEHSGVQEGSLNNLLQAYLTMVPDIQYGRGLVYIAGCLLQMSPEEDAFWTFISLMDTHLRPYFSSNAIQLEIDASLFGKAVDAHDSIASKRVFVDMAIHPIQLCRTWFSALFVEVLPPEYQYRIWDIFLFEGVAFLFRVGLAIISCCKRMIMDTSGRDNLLAGLLRPPIALLPASPDAFLELAFSVKLKDDDIRKQRNKKDVQTKRQTQFRSLSAQTGASMPNISLPKT
ncbi:unnamed protein product [Somion occarium]|uniref:Rab-GAP TBC domain-containing protein n=3 Tax=Somion occarium TaxID=3059160 RepID=A0ABP1CNZ0_9APHY